jgi:hypothetical protein
MIPTFDIEATDWTNPIAVGLFDGETYRDFLKEDKDTDVIWDFLQYLGKNCEGYHFYAHNASGYDNRFLLSCLIKHGQKVRLETGLGRLVWVAPDISFEDSFLVVGLNLAALCKAFRVPRKLEWDHNTTKNIWDLGSRLDSFRTYLQRDVTSLSLAMDKYCQSLLGAFGVTPSATVSLTSVKAFNRSFFAVKDIDANEAQESFIREATYGARNEVYKRYGEDLNLYDIRSMYVSCYDTPVPIGRMYWRRPVMERGTLAEATVEVPKDWKIGPLPYKRRGHLIFPVGTFSSWWDMYDLRNAEALGVTVKLHRQLEADEQPILKDFGEHISRLRYESSPEESQAWKLLGLRLVGKMGQRRYRSEIVHSDDIEDFTGYSPVDAEEMYHEKVTYLKGNKAPYVKPAISMRIRAEARIRHLNLLLKSDPYYCDTDSNYTTTNLPIGDNQGELQLVGFAKRAYFIRCKLYGYVNQNGVLKQRAAGFRDFRLTEYDFRQLLAGKTIEHYANPISDWKELLDGAAVKLQRIPRKARGNTIEDNRLISGLETYPIVVKGRGRKGDADAQQD